MPKIDPIYQIQAMHGKVHSHSESMFVTNSSSGQVSTRMNTYHYFLKTRMDEGKNSVTLKIAKSKSSEETYVKGMQRCQTIAEADRLLVDFVEKLGYKHLAQAYKEIRKNEVRKHVGS